AEARAEQEQLRREADAREEERLVTKAKAKQERLRLEAEALEEELRAAAEAERQRLEFVAKAVEERLQQEEKDAEDPEDAERLEFVAQAVEERLQREQAIQEAKLAEEMSPVQPARPFSDAFSQNSAHQKVAFTGSSLTATGGPPSAASRVQPPLQPEPQQMASPAAPVQPGVPFLNDPLGGGRDTAAFFDRYNQAYLTQKAQGNQMQQEQVEPPADGVSEDGGAISDYKAF
ncbi:expressed unknown protein (Partial), partial [Seminavis robusta]